MAFSNILILYMSNKEATRKITSQYLNEFSFLTAFLRLSNIWRIYHKWRYLVNHLKHCEWLQPDCSFIFGNTWARTWLLHILLHFGRQFSLFLHQFLFITSLFRGHLRCSLKIARLLVALFLGFFFGAIEISHVFVLLFLIFSSSTHKKGNFSDQWAPKSRENDRGSFVLYLIFCFRSLISVLFALVTRFYEDAVQSVFLEFKKYTGAPLTGILCSWEQFLRQSIFLEKPFALRHSQASRHQMFFNPFFERQSLLWSFFHFLKTSKKAKSHVPQLTLSETFVNTCGSYCVKPRDTLH